MRTTIRSMRGVLGARHIAAFVTVTLGFCTLANAQTLTPRVDEAGNLIATVNGAPFLRGVTLRHAGIGEGALKLQTKEGGEEYSAAVSGEGGNAARWSTSVQNGQLRIAVKFDGETTVAGKPVLMDAVFDFDPNVLTGRRYELTGDVRHEAGPVATISAAGEFAPNAEGRFTLTPLRYSTTTGLRFYGENDIIDIHSTASFSVTEATANALRLRVLPARGVREFALTIKGYTYEQALRKILSAPGITERDLSVPPGANLHTMNGGFEEPFVKPISTQDRSSFNWGLSLHENSQATIEPSSTDAHSGQRSLHFVKKTQDGYVQIYQHFPRDGKSRVSGFDGTPAERDGERYLLSYWARTRATATLRGGVYIYNDLNNAADIKYGEPLAFRGITQHTDITPWTRMDHIFTLKKGQSIGGLMFTLTGKQGDEAFLDDIAIHRVPDDFQMLEPLQIIQSPWPVVPPELLAKLPVEIAQKKTTGNIIENSSFEAGADRLSRGGWREDQQTKIDRKVAFHGGASLLVDGQTYPATIMYNIEPGRLHTLSFYARSEKPNANVYVEALSGLSAVYSGDDWRTNLGVRRTFTLSPEWKRYSVAFIPTTRLIPTINVKFSSNTQNEGKIWVDAVQLEQGQSTPYALDKPLQVSASVEVAPQQMMDISVFAGRIETHMKPLAPGEKWERPTPPNKIFAPEDNIPFRATVYSEKPGAVQCEWQFIDYYNRVARVEKRTVQVGPQKYSEDRFTLSGFDNGSYVIRMKASSPGGLATVAEETGFAVLPSALNDFNFDTDFGFHCWEPSWVNWHRRLGFHTLRTLDGIMWPSTAWALNEPERGKYQFSDKSARWLLDQGFKLSLTFSENTVIMGGSSGRLAPEWAKVEPSQFPVGTPENSFGFDSKAYLKYVEQAVRFWRGKVDSYEIWNEPYGQKNSARPTAELGRKIAEIIRREDPNARIMGPCSFWGAGVADWTEQTMQILKTDLLDTFSYHGYPTRLHEETPWSFTKGLSNYNRIMAENGGIRPMADTELNASKTWLWSDRFRGSGNLTYMPDPGENDRDQFFPKVFSQYYIIARAHGVNEFYMYQAWEPGYGTHDDQTPGNALISTSVNGWLLGGSKFLEQIDLGEKVRCYVFETRDKKLLAGVFGLQMDKPGKISFALPASGTTAYGTLGTKLWPNKDAVPLARAAGNGLEIQLSRDPIYLVAPSGMNRTTFVNGLKQAQLGGVANLVTQPFVLGGADGKPQIAIAARNLSPSTPLAADVSFEVPQGSAWRVGQSKISGRIAPREEGVLSAPLSGLPQRAGTVEVLKTTVSSEGLDKPATQSVRVAGIARAPRGVAVDGDLKEWANTPVSASIDRKEQVKEEKPGVTWGGPSDASLQMKLAWDEQNLYLAADVKDDKFVMDREAKDHALAYWYLADSIELFLDVSNRASNDRREATDAKYHLLFIAGRGNDRRADWMNTDFPNPLSGVLAASKFRPDGYQIEAAIPLKNFPALQKGEAGKVVRFFAALNDRDEPGDTYSRRDAGMLWYDIPEWYTDSREYVAGVFLP